MHPLTIFTITLLPSLFPCAITATTAISLAPSLLDHSAQLEDALADYKTAQIQIAAIKLKSLLPASRVVSEDKAKMVDSSVTGNLKNENSDDEDDSSSSSSSSDNNSDDDDDSSDVDEVPTSTTLLLTPLNNLLKQLDAPAVAQINSFNFSFQSLDDFVVVKEQEATQKLQESLAAIRDIQRVLQSHPSANTSQIISSKLLARLIAKMDALQEEYEEIQTLEKRLKSTKEEKRNKSKKELVNSHIKIQKIVQRLSEIVVE